jgi:hypothetical protein
MMNGVPRRLDAISCFEVGTPTAGQLPESGIVATRNDLIVWTLTKMVSKKVVQYNTVVSFPLQRMATSEDMGHALY